MLNLVPNRAVPAPHEGRGPILFVDDEPLILRAFSTLLRRNGYEVETAGSVREALRLASRFYFPLVVTDLRMPGTDGLSLIEKLRETQPESVYLIVTGVPDLDLGRPQEVDASILAIIQKPWEETELLGAIDRALEVYEERLHADGATPEQSRQVLLLEDDALYASSVCRLLGQDGSFEIHHVERLADAVRHVRKSPVDVILADLSLPDARGLDSILRLRQICPDAVILALSGLDDETVAAQAVRLGAQDYLVKGHAETERSLRRAIRFANGRREAEKRLRQLAHYDAQTGLLNRPTFLAQAASAVSRTQRRNGMTALGILDLDRFKELNDRFGSEAADQVLELLAERLSEIIGDCDLLARTGGDEFAFVIEELSSIDDAVAVAERLLAAVRQPLTVKGNAGVTVTASLGLAVLPGAGESVRELMRVADGMLYAVKAQGRDAFDIHYGDPNSEVMQRFRMEAELRRAVSQGALEVELAPIVSLSDGETVALESRASWTRSGSAALSGEALQKALDRIGLLMTAAEQMLRRSCAALAVRRATQPNLRLSIDAPRAVLDGVEWVDVVSRALDEHGLPPSALSLEITEEALMSADRAVIATLEALRALGVRLTVDRFGTGYSSLRYLDRYGVHTLKIDPSFVRELLDPSAPRIAAAIVALGERLGIEVTADGVEAESEREALARLGCRAAQGPLFSPR